MHLLRTAFIFLIIVLLADISPTYAKRVEQQLFAFKIFVADNDLARKIAISYHHAILEMNYEQGYIIADLSQKEIKELQAFDLKIESATQWNLKYQGFQASIEKQSKNVKDNKLLAGIPGFECYPTVEETLEQGNSLATTYPMLTNWIDIGDSWKKANGQTGYDLMVLKITNKDIAQEKPKLFIHSSMHAREYAPAALTLDFARHLLENYNANADIQWIVNYHEIHILFHMNPDGRKIAETGIWQRKNANDNHCPTGSGNEYIGVDLNRNFAFFWNYTNGGGSSGESCNQTFRGTAAESEPETQAVSNYIRSLFPDVRGPNDEDAAPIDTAGMHLDIHSYSQLVLWPWGQKTTPSPNEQGFVALGNKLAWFNNYTPMQSVGLYPTDGTSDDVSYGELGIAAFTFELGTEFFEQCSVYENVIKPDNLNSLIYAAKVTAAPYTLAFGPEISKIESNGAIGEISVAQGTPLTIDVTANALQTKESTVGRTISKAEYTIDSPIWQMDTTAIEFNQNDGNLSSGIEVFSALVNTTNLSLGRHIIYTRAYDQNDNVGVTQAEFFTVSNNNSPIPEFTASCNDLSCIFDATDSSDPDGSIDSYLWNFGDDSTNSGSVVEHSYSEAGDKLVTLTIQDNASSQAVKQLTISVTEPSTTTPPTPDDSNNANSSSGGGVLSWLLASLLIAGRFRRSREWPNFNIVHLPNRLSKDEPKC